MKWDRDESDPKRVRKLELAIEDCLMMAGRKRANRYTYHKDTNDTIHHGPRSDDEDWDHIKRFCQRVGCDFSVIRAAVAVDSEDDSRTAETPYVTWEYTATGDKNPAWQLMVGHGENRRSAASVWLNGVWHTWDQNGHGGENSTEQDRLGHADVKRAKIEAAASAIAQEFI